jgi:hypothetical protein
MSITQPKLLTFGGLFILIFVFGCLLSRQGKPYGVLLFNAHKLIALGTMVFLGVQVYNRHQIEPLTSNQILWLAVAVVIAAITIVIGGLLNTHLNLPEPVKVLHKIFPYLTLASSAASIYFVFMK